VGQGRQVEAFAVSRRIRGFCGSYPSPTLRVVPLPILADGEADYRLASVTKL